MLIEIRHTTTYTYDTPARYSVQNLRLTPPSFDGQQVLSWAISAPGFDRNVSYRDGFGNKVHLTSLRAMHDGMTIEASGIVETDDRFGIVRGLDEMAPRRVFMRETPRTAPDKAVRDLARSVSNGKIPTDVLDCHLARAEEKRRGVIDHRRAAARAVPSLTRRLAPARHPLRIAHGRLRNCWHSPLTFASRAKIRSHTAEHHGLSMTVIHDRRGCPIQKSY